MGILFSYVVSICVCDSFLYFTHILLCTNSLKLLICILTAWIQTVLSDPEAAAYVDGVAFHWYTELDDSFSDFFLLSDVHKKFPNVFLFATEACEGSLPWNQGVRLGLWSRGGTYGHDILQDLEHWSTGWTDWSTNITMLFLFNTYVLRTLSHMFKYVRAC